MKKLLKRLFAPSNTREDLGRRGEREAERFLKKRGYRIIERNYRTRHGEIDLVALYGDTLVFVEVKTRLSQEFGLPQDSVRGKKRTHIVKVAGHFIAENPQFRDHNVRFDVVGITMEGRTPRIEHIAHAFDVEGKS